MKQTSLQKIALLLVLNFTIGITAFAQTAFQTHDIDIKLNGTSNIHDWEMTADKGTSEALLVIDATGKITGITKLSFTLLATNLKSEHTKMDKNTYKALNTDVNPNISFVQTSSTVSYLGNNKYQVMCNGKLSIAGTTKITSITATGIYNPADNSFTVSGSKSMKMTDYNVPPPKAMLGTIKTGNEITISYNLKLKK